MMCWHHNNKTQKCRNWVFGTAASSMASIWHPLFGMQHSDLGIDPASVCPPPPPTLSVQQISLCLFIGCHWSLKLPNTVYVCMRVLMCRDYARTLIRHRFVGYTHAPVFAFAFMIWECEWVPNIRESTLPTFAQCYMYNCSSSATINNHLFIEEKENSK